MKPRNGQETYPSELNRNNWAANTLCAVNPRCPLIREAFIVANCHESTEPPASCFPRLRSATLYAERWIGGMQISSPSILLLFSSVCLFRPSKPQPVYSHLRKWFIENQNNFNRNFIKFPPSSMISTLITRLQLTTVPWFISLLITVWMVGLSTK